MLGLYNEDGLLDHVGFTSSITAADRSELTKKLERLIEPPGFTGNAPCGPSRWSRGKENAWQPLKPKLVVEVCFDHVSSRAASATVRSCSAGGPTRRPNSARWINSPKGNRICCNCLNEVSLSTGNWAAAASKLGPERRDRPVSRRAGVDFYFNFFTHKAASSFLGMRLLLRGHRVCSSSRVQQRFAYLSPYGFSPTEKQQRRRGATNERSPHFPVEPMF